MAEGGESDVVVGDRHIADGVIRVRSDDFEVKPSADHIIACDGDIVCVAELVRNAHGSVGKASRSGIQRLIKEIVGDGDGPGRLRNIDRVAMRSCVISLAGEVVAGDNALLNPDRVFWRIQKAVVLYCYVLSGTDPDILLGRRFAACKGTILHYGAAGTGLVYSPKARRGGECAILYRDIVGIDNHRGVAKIDAAEHSAGLSDIYDVCGWGIIVGRLVVLGDFRNGEQRGRGVWVAGHGVDARQNGAGIGVADRLDFFCGDHAIAPRSRRENPPSRAIRWPPLSGAELDC